MTTEVLLVSFCIDVKLFYLHVYCSHTSSTIEAFFLRAFLMCNVSHFNGYLVIIYFNFVNFFYSVPAQAQ